MVCCALQQEAEEGELPRCAPRCSLRCARSARHTLAHAPQAAPLVFPEADMRALTSLNNGLLRYGVVKANAD